MTLRLELLQVADIPSYTEVELSAFKSHPRTPMIWTKGQNASVHAYINDRKQAELQNPKEPSMKCIDVTSGKLVAGATYTFAFEVQDGRPIATAPAESIAEDAPPPSNWPDGGNWNIVRWYKINTPRIVQQYMGGRPFISITRTFHLKKLY